MKKIITTLIFAVIFLASNAQEINPKIKEVYGDKTQELFGNDPDRLKIYNDLINNRITIIESPISGKEKCQKLSQMELMNRYNPSLVRDLVFDPTTFNPLKYKLNFFSSTSTNVYRVDNTNYIIIIQPQTTQKK